jgi:signal transduction histidine kinase
MTRLLAAYDQLFSAAETGAVTPAVLGAVKTAATAADMAYLSVEIPKAIQQSLDGVSRVTHIVRAMKEFSHPGTKEKTPVDLAKAIQSTLTVASNEWKYVAELVTEFDPALPPVICLPGEFNQVVLNLIVNAAHAIADVVGDGSKGKGTITVRTRRDGDWAEIRICDSGTGIPESARAKLFEPFFTTKGVGKGTGQGLAIAHSVVVDKHGGTIHFETELGKGTTFVIRLPLGANDLKEKKAA